MKLALITAANRFFFPGAIALLEGAIRYHPEVERWCIVPESDLQEAKNKLGGLAQLKLAPRMVQGVPEHLQICVAKLFTPTIPADRIAYIDSDAIFCRPSPELWDISPGKVNVIQDTSKNVYSTVHNSMKKEFLKQFPDIALKKAFNGGVWALEPKEATDLAERYESALKEGRYKTYHPVFDQPLLNALWQPNVKWLPFQFNVNNLFDNTIPKDARIVHFTGGTCKPWDSRYPKWEPQYYWWLRHGLNETRLSKLLTAQFRIWLMTPKRLLGRRYRKWQERDN